jgi:hypothetical protein
MRIDQPKVPAETLEIVLKRTPRSRQQGRLRVIAA